MNLHPFLRRALRAAVAGACAGACIGASVAAEAPIVVTGVREAIAIERLVADVVVLDAERIRASAADSVEDLLRREAGVQLSRSGGPGSNSGVLMRGAHSGLTLVLIDGVRIGSATTGIAELEALSLASVERIEVLRGPASSLYGADAVGGVVQIFTRRGGDTPRFAARAALGGYGAREGSVSGSGRIGAFDLAAGLSHEGNDGVSALRPADRFGNYNPDDDGFARRHSQAQLGFTPSPGQRIALLANESRLDAQYDGAEFAPPDFSPDATPDFRNHYRLRSSALQHDGRWNESWSTRLRATRQSSDMRAGASLPDHFRTERRQYEAQASWMPTAGHTFTLALDRLEERAASSSYVAPVARDNDALALAYAGSLGALDLQADLRRDDNSVYGGVTTGRLGAAWALGGGWRLRALAGTTFHAPSFNDLYFPGFGVPTLRPERGRSAELGLQWRRNGHEFGATVYRNRVRELIGYEIDRSLCPAGPEYDFGCARNIGRARLQGASLSGATRLGGWSLRASLEFLDATDGASGARLTRRAAHQEMLAAGYDAGAWRFGAELLRVGARPEGGRMLAAYETLDLKARWRIDGRWHVEARLLNATDRDYEPALDYRTLGRQAWIGVGLDLAGL